jgi:hypothetical protein
VSVDAHDTALRERTLARTMVRAAMRASDVDHAGATDVDLGRFVGLRQADALWLSARAVAGDAGATSSSATRVLGTALTAVAQSNLRGSAPIVRVTIVGDKGSLGVVARQAAYFPLNIAVAELDDARLSLVAPAAHTERREPAAAHLEFVETFRAAGAEAVVEHGVVAAEVRGLEVARIVDEDGTARMRIGVGVHDRETFRMLHGEAAGVDHLRDVVRHVTQHRADGAPAHPLNRLAPERALRALVASGPGRIGARAVRYAEPPVVRANLKDSVPCVATATMQDGEDAVVIFTAGVMVDAVPFAADARDRLNPQARLFIVAESRNVLPTQQFLSSLLRQPAAFVSA